MLDCVCIACSSGSELYGKGIRLYQTDGKRVEYSRPYRRGFDRHKCGLSIGRKVWGKWEAIDLSFQETANGFASLSATCTVRFDLADNNSMQPYLWRSFHLFNDKYFDGKLPDLRYLIWNPKRIKKQSGILRFHR